MEMQRALSAMVLVTSVVVAPFAQVPSPSPAPARAHGLDADRSRRLRDWLTASRAHRAGELDPPATRIAAWPAAALAFTIADVVALARMRSDLEAAPPGEARRYRSRTFCVCTPSGSTVDLNALFVLGVLDRRPAATNPALERGALLHTDIATLSTSGSDSIDGPGRQIQTQHADGAVLAVQGVTAHWRFARLLLDGVLPAPSSDDLVGIWYRATSAYQASRRSWVDALPNLERGLQVLPDDRRLLFYSGALHETFASPGIQAGVRDLVRAGYLEDVVNERPRTATRGSLLDEGNSSRR